MKRLGAPLRLTWDWDWPPIAHPGAPPRRPTAAQVRAIGAEVVRAQVLLLEVGYPEAAALRSRELAAALEGFAGSLSLVLAPEVALAVADLRAGLGAEELWVDVTPGSGPLPAGLEGWPAVRCYLTSTNLDAATLAIERALAWGAHAVSLPNLPLFGEVLPLAATITPDAARLAALAARLAGAQRARPGLDLRVHHYGLWQALRAAGAHPSGEDAPGAGCQAGAALGYVDPAGLLHPCASLPVPLARVEEGALRAAWAGAELAALREGILRVPARCAGCALEPTCRGGCRGWAHYLAGTWDATGPDCRRPSD